jgi:5'(3')-deoxyribonucleotidase
MMINRIFLDLDDVLNSLTMDILHEVFECVPDTGFEHFPVHLGYDIIGAVAYLRGEEPMDAMDFWEQVPPEVWSEAPKSLECNWLVDMAAELVGREEVYIATATGRGISPLKIAGKVDWIRGNLPPWLHEQYFIASQKWQLGRPGHILIDDSATNCANWSLEGGEYILVPRPWNPLHTLTDDAHSYVQTQIDHLLSRTL